MPDTRSHRGPHPEDREFFAPSAYAGLQSAVADLGWLLGHGYGENSSLKLVGDRYALTARQRQAVARSACGTVQRKSRKNRETVPAFTQGKRLLLDGFNVLTTIEVALSGGVVLSCADQCFRDIAGMHGHYRMLEETNPALDVLKLALQDLSPAAVAVYLDQPVSNSGRLAQRLRDTFQDSALSVEVLLVPDPDVTLLDQGRRPGTLVGTADSGILDRCGLWLNLAKIAVQRFVPQAWIVPMDGIMEGG